MHLHIDYVPHFGISREVLGFFTLITNITERKRMEEEIRDMAQHDALTGLPNRRLFRDILQVEASQARRNRKKLSVLFLDIDRFKEINDTLGHDAGDELLRQVADRLRKSIRQSDAVARIGGDEFNVLISETQDPDDITATARKIMNAFEIPYGIAGQELRINDEYRHRDLPRRQHGHRKYTTSPRSTSGPAGWFVPERWRDGAIRNRASWSQSSSSTPQKKQVLSPPLMSMC